MLFDFLEIAKALLNKMAQVLNRFIECKRAKKGPTNAKWVPDGGVVQRDATCPGNCTGAQKLKKGLAYMRVRQTRFRDMRLVLSRV